MELKEIMNNIHPLSAGSMELISDEADRICVGKNEIIISAGRICRHIYFVAEGVVRAFYRTRGRDITFWIGEEGSVALSMQSYVNGRAGYETISTLEDCVLFRISIESLNRLYSRNIYLANWGRKFAEKEILRAEKSLIPQLFATGRERYEALLAEQPGLLNRIPLEVIATYLGMTPVSLSRIRGQIVENPNHSRDHRNAKTF